MPAVVLVVAAVGYLTQAQRGDDGSIARAGSIAATELVVGDCFDDPAALATSDGPTEVSDLAAVPCSQPHDNEVFHVITLPDGDYPGDAAFETAVVEQCTPAFERYVGMDYPSSQLALTFLSPTAISWTAGDRTIACFAYEMDLSKIEGTVRGVAR